MFSILPFHYILIPHWFLFIDLLGSSSPLSKQKTQTISSANTPVKNIRCTSSDKRGKSQYFPQGQGPETLLAKIVIFLWKNAEVSDEGSLYRKVCRSQP